MKIKLTFLKKLFLLILLFCLLDFLSGIVLGKMFDKQKSGKYYTTAYGLEKADEKVLIFGNSHANENINSPLIEEKLKLSTFNLGNQGQSLLYQYPLIKTILQRKSPELVIIVLSYNSIKYIKEDYPRLSIYLPFRGINKYVDSAIVSSDKNEWYKSYSSLYKYNSTIGYMLMNTYKKSYKKSYESRGYDPTPGIFCNKRNIEVRDDGENLVKTAPAKEFKLDSLKIKYLISIIDELNAKNIKTVFIATPLYETPGIDNDLYFLELKKLLASKNATFWNFSRDSFFETKCELFNDPGHLNEVGATLFTEHLIEKIKTIL